MKISKIKIELMTAQKGLSMKELADKCDMSRQNLSTIKNRGTCNLKTAFRISKALNCDIADISEIKDDNT